MSLLLILEINLLLYIIQRMPITKLESCTLLFLLFHIYQAQILDPASIEHLMFTEEITGRLPLALPSQKINRDNQAIQETYVITMQKTKQKMLPGNYSPTTLYAYSALTVQGQYIGFPGPLIIAKKNIPTKIKWVNSIFGPHFLPVDFSSPFINDPIFRNQVPTVPHMHGIVSSQISDGLPFAYWTALGSKSSQYKSESPCKPNQAIYRYTNQQQTGIFWYHDHTYGITRLNVYAGLAGFYEIVDNPMQKKSVAEKNIEKHVGLNESKLYFLVADKSFQSNGQLFYPDQSFSKSYTSWVPEFFGNMMTVNGKVWPKIVLSKKKYRMTFLNGCQCRYLNIYFEHISKKLPFQLLRVDGDYFINSIVSYQYFLSPGGRIQVLLDLTQINGEVVIRNNAQAPHPIGDPLNLVNKFTGTIMKIVINNHGSVQTTKIVPFIDKIKKIATVRTDKMTIDLNEHKPILLKEGAIFPAFPQGQRVFQVLTEVNDDEMETAGMYIGGVSMHVGKNCEGSIFEINKVYDFQIINLTPDTHPIHFHIANLQKVYSYPIDVQAYSSAWKKANGGEPPYEKVSTPLDPRSYQIGEIITPKSYQQAFKDIVDVLPGMTTVIRIKFSHNDGSPYRVKVNGGKFVWHCHMLEHEDNEMMKHFCLK